MLMCGRNHHNTGKQYLPIKEKHEAEDNYKIISHLFLCLSLCVCFNDIGGILYWNNGHIIYNILLAAFSHRSVQSLRHVWLFATPWTAARQASLSITNSQSLRKLMSTESVMPSNHLILCCPLLPPSIFLSIRVFTSESVLCTGGQSIGVSASASVLPMNI